MVKLVTALAMIALVWVFSTQYDYGSKNTLTSPIVSVIPEISLSPTPSTESAVIFAEIKNWKTFEDKSLGFNLRYPPDVTLKKHSDKSISLGKTGLSITISQEKLIEDDTLNLAAEVLANKIISNTKSINSIVDTISPVAIDTVTGLTFTTLENDKEVTYYYVPQGSTYLLITNTTQAGGSDLLSISDDIIYSLELVQSSSISLQ